MDYSKHPPCGLADWPLADLTVSYVKTERVLRWDNV